MPSLTSEEVGLTGLPARRQVRFTGTQLDATTSWHTALGAWAEYLSASGKPRSTVRLRMYHLSRLAEDVGGIPGGLGFDALVSWMAGHSGWKPSTMRSFRSSFRMFFEWAVAAGVAETSPAHQLPSVKVPRGRPRPTPEKALLEALIGADERTGRAIRIAAQCGLRGGELARIRTEDVEPCASGWQLRVLGKGGHVRLVPLTDELALELRGLPVGWVFPSPRGGHLTPHHLAKTISARFDEGLTTHSLRHRCGTVAYRGTRDLRAVQELLGHAKPETTALYTEVAEDTVRAAMQAAGIGSRRSTPAA